MCSLGVDEEAVCGPVLPDGCCVHFLHFGVELLADEEGGFGGRRFVGLDPCSASGDEVEADPFVLVYCGGVDEFENVVAEFLRDCEEGWCGLVDGVAELLWNRSVCN
jgi:hypothetical protein